MTTTVKGQPISGGRNFFNPKKKPLVPDAKETSANAQTMIKEDPAPFKNNQTAAQQPTGVGASGGISTLEPKIKSGLTHQSPGVKALPPRGPVGQKKPINQSGQMNGRFGTTFPKKVGGADLVSKYPKKGNAKFYGE